jgi:hypothetical protein
MRRVVAHPVVGLRTRVVAHPRPLNGLASRPLALAWLAAAALGSGCGDDSPASEPDAASADGSSVPGTDTTGDPGPEADVAAPEDAAEADLGTPAPDASGDTGPDDATSAVACGEPMDLTRFAARCNGVWTLGSDFSFPEAPAGSEAACPPFVRLRGADYPTREAALQAASCETDCVLAQRISVSAVYCRADCMTLQRYGWITFGSETPGCPELHELPGGLYTSVEEWLLAQPDVCARGATACLEAAP